MKHHHLEQQQQHEQDIPLVTQMALEHTVYSFVIQAIQQQKTLHLTKEDISKLLKYLNLHIQPDAACVPFNTLASVQENMLMSLDYEAGIEGQYLTEIIEMIQPFLEQQIFEQKTRSRQISNQIFDPKQVLHSTQQMQQIQKQLQHAQQQHVPYELTAHLAQQIKAFIDLNHQAKLLCVPTATLNSIHELLIEGLDFSTTQEESYLQDVLEMLLPYLENDSQ